MDIEFKCGSCGKMFGAAGKHAGRKVECSACRAPLTIPFPDGLAGAQYLATAPNNIERLNRECRVATTPDDARQLKKGVAPPYWLDVVFSLGAGERQCFFCDLPRAEGSCACMLEMYFVLGAKEVIPEWQTDVHYNKVSLPVPRCPECKKYHSSRDFIEICKVLAAVSPIVLLVGGVVGHIIGENSMLARIIGYTVFWLGVAAAAVCGPLWLIKKREAAAPYPMRGDNHAASWPIVRQLEKMGWRRGDRPYRLGSLNE